MKKEVISFAPDYVIYENGLIWYSKKEKFINLHNDKGYLKAKLKINGNWKNYLLHRILMLTFVPNPNNYPIINHIDTNTLNNELSNLEWCNNSHNVKHGYKVGKADKKGMKNYQSKLTDYDIPKIRELINSGISTYKIANIFKVTRGCIAHVKQNRSWTHIQ